MKVRTNDDEIVRMEYEMETLDMQVLPKAGAKIGQILQPIDLFRLKFVIVIDNTNIDLETILVLK